MAESVSEKGTHSFARDDSKAEKALEEQKEEPTGHLRGSTFSNEPRRTPSKVSLVDEVSRRQDDSLDFREDAKVWYLYLEEAEQEAKERAELWRTGLDSLLIFAGLFAGVVSSFVIDARPDLQADSEQRLLEDIREVLANGPISEAMKIPVSARLISALWTLSLYITLFGSIMGVLAKAWLAKFVPATTRREAKDAYQRYALDQQAERWYLREVLTLVPLLVQIASFLFLIGFVLQSYDDDLTIGRIIAVFCASGGLLYLIMTILPLFVSTSPFDTPFSDFLLWGRDLALALVHRRRFSELPGQVKKDVNEGLAEILYTKLIKSPKQTHVDEAIAEVASMAFKDKWVVFLCQTETPQILLARFRYCAAATSEMPTEQRNETLRNCLMVLLRFAETYEREVAPKIQDSSIPEGYQTLAAVLRNSLEPENPLHRWNRLPEDLRPLLFSVRTAVLKLMPPSEVADFSIHELFDRPWEMTLQDIHSGHRFHFVLAACFGIFQDQPNLKIVSTATLALSLSRAASSTIESGRVTEWTGILSTSEREMVHDLAPLFLLKLQEVTATRWEDLILEMDSGPTETTPLTTQRASRLLTFLVGCLSAVNADWALQCHAIYLLEDLSQTQLPNGPFREVKSLVHGEALDSILYIAMVAKDDDDFPEVTDKALKLLANLSLFDFEIHKLVQDKIVDRIKEDIDGSSYYIDGRQTVEFMSSCFRGGHIGVFYGWFPRVLPNLIRLGLKDFPSDHSSAVWEFLHTGLTQVFNFDSIISGYNEVVKKYVLEEVKAILDDTDDWRQYRILQSILDFLQNGFPPSDALATTPSFAFPWSTPADLVSDIMETSVDRIVKIAASGYEVMGSNAALEILRRSSTSALLDRAPKVNTLEVLENVVFAPHLFDQRRAALDALTCLTHRLDIENPSIFKMLLEVGYNPTDEPYFRQRCLDLIKAILLDFRDMSEEVMEAIQSAVVCNSPQILSETDSAVQEAWIGLLSHMGKRVSLVGVVPVLLSMLAKVHGRGIPSRSVGDYFSLDPPPDAEVETLASLEDPHRRQVLISVNEIRGAIAKGIPQDLLVSFAAPTEWENAAGWFEILLALKRLDGLSGLADDAFALAIDVVNQATDHSSSSVSGVAQTHKMVHEGSSERVDVPPPQLLSEFHAIDRTAWIRLVTILAQHSPEAFRWTPGFIIGLAVEDPDDEVRNACISSLIFLVELDGMRVPLSGCLAGQFSRIAEKGSANVRASLATLVGSFAGSEPSLIPDAIVNELLGLAWEDTDSEVRRRAIAALFKLATSNSQEGQRYNKLIAQGSFEAKYEAILSNPNHDSWRWLQLKSRCMHTQEAHNVSRLLDAAVLQNEDMYYVDFKTEADVLVDLLQQADHRDSVASAVAQALIGAMRKPNPRIREQAYSLLGSLFLLPPPSEGFYTYTPEALWLYVVIFLGRSEESQSAVKILEKALRDNPKDGFGFLSATSDHTKLLEPLPTILSRALSTALKPDSNEDIRSAAVKLFDCLVNPTRGVENGSRQPSTDEFYEHAHLYVTLLSRHNDSQIVSRLIEGYVKDRDYLSQSKAEAALEGAVSFHFTRFSSLVKTALSKAIDSALADTNIAIRSNAVRILDSLTVRLSGSERTVESARFFRDEIVSFSLPHLLKVALVEIGGNSTSQLRMDTKNLIRNHVSKPGMTGSVAFSNALWTAIPPLIPAITVDGREIVLDLAVSDLNMSSETVAAIAKALVPVFRDGSSFARSTAVELLSSLYLKHGVQAPGLVVFAVPEIVALALDDKDDVGTLRSTAISLLVAILNATIKNIYISESVFKQITPQTVKFMALLRHESLRTPVVRLLSVLSTDTRVRKTISLRIINSVISTVKANEAMENYAELLARLVAEERFGREPTDFLVLTLLPSVLERQQFVPFRTVILTALWCRYSGERVALAVHHVPKDLVEWLKFALFGRHATAYEVKTWCARCQGWLSAAGVDINQNLRVSVEGSFVRETTPLATPPAVEEDRNDLPDTQNDSQRSESVITPPKDRLLLDQWTFNGQLLLESHHPVLYQGESYPTAAHLFQAMKYLPERPHLAQFFRTLPAVEGPELPYTSTQYNAWKRRDWDTIAVEKLEEALLCKFQQNDGPKTVLLHETGDTELVDISGSFFMGLEYGVARPNSLGEALMRVRSRLRKEQEAEPSSDETH